jgi:hypothetical protein
LEVCGSRQPEISLHLSLSFPSFLGEREETCNRGESALPVDFLAVVIHSDRQAVAAFGAAALDYLSTASCGHPFSKPMDAHPMAHLGLVGSFGHEFSFLNK